MKILGALLAGGKSERFGSDKAMALYQGQYLIDHAIELLKPQCDAILICGRIYEDYLSIKDDLQDQGPLGGICAALKYAKDQGYDGVMSFPCDTIGRDKLSGASIEQPWFDCEEPAYLSHHPVIGYWPSSLSERLEKWLHSQNQRSMMAWAEHIGAMSIEIDQKFININRPDDLPNGKINGLY